MNISWSLVAFLLCCNSYSFGQDSQYTSENLPLQVVMGEGLESNHHDFTSTFSKSISDKFILDDYAILQVEVNGIFEDPKSIEGIESRTFVNGRFEIKLRNLIDDAVVWTEKFKSMGKASNGRLAISDAVRKFASNALFIKDLQGEIEKNYSKILSENCENTLNKITKQGSWEELNRAFQLLQYFESSPCSESAAVRVSDVSTAIDEIACKNVMHDLSIRIESGQFDSRFVLLKLLSISPDATCANEAVELAKRMGEMKGRFNQSDRTVISQYVQILLLDKSTTRSKSYHQLRWHY